MINAILVDDEEPCLDSLNLLLDNYCPDVRVTGRYSSGKAALDAIGQLRPDLVFLDIQMPRMNGFELLGQFKHFSSLSFLQPAMINTPLKHFIIAHWTIC